MDETKELLQAILKNQETARAQLEAFQKEMNHRMDKLERQINETHRRTLFLETKMYDELQ